jgi:hypothetical protein
MLLEVRVGIRVVLAQIRFIRACAVLGQTADASQGTPKPRLLHDQLDIQVQLPHSRPACRTHTASRQLHGGQTRCPQKAPKPIAPMPPPALRPGRSLAPERQIASAALSRVRARGGLGG